MNQLEDKLESGEFVVTSELNPPKGTDLSELIEKAEGLRHQVTAFNLTDSHAARMSMGPLAVAHLLLDRGIEPILQMTSRDKNRIALQGDMLAASALGIRNLVCMGGDPPHLGDHPEAKPVFDLGTMELIGAARALTESRDMMGNPLKGAASLHIGAVVNPGADDLEGEIRRLEQKAEAGARFFQTQAVYDPDRFENFLDRIAPLNLKILVGIIPVKSARMAAYLNANIPGIEVPDQVISEIEQSSDKRRASEALCARLIERLAPRCAGVHIMAMGWEDSIAPVLEAAGIK